jgi:hypothetical protein
MVALERYRSASSNIIFALNLKCLIMQNTQDCCEPNESVTVVQEIPLEVVWCNCCHFIKKLR